jgi:hypothetical protein
MGLLDDLAMGFGLKERTEDYDARTARNIAAGGVGGASDHATMIANIRARQNYNPSSPSKQAAYYLDRAGAQGGYEAGEYRPAIAEDNRPMFQRILTSPASSPSPRPYAIGPLTMDQPLPSFGLLGLFTQGLSNMFQGRDDSGKMGPPRTTVRPVLRPDDFTPPTFPTGNGQDETTFTEDFSGVDVYDPATDYIAPDFSETMPLITAEQDFATDQDFLDTVQSAIDTAQAGERPPLSNANFYDPAGVYGMRKGTSSIRMLPTGRFVDISTGKILF